MLVEAYDKTTGEQHPDLVPAHFIGHPVLGPNLVPTKPTVSGTAAGKSAKKEGGQKNG